MDAFKRLNRDTYYTLNAELAQVFDLIDYQTRFKMKFSLHALNRITERMTAPSAVTFGKLLRRIVPNGICELLYYQTRYINGGKIEHVELVLDDVYVPLAFIGDFVTMRTVMIRAPEYKTLPRMMGIQIDLGDDRWNKK